MVAKNVNKFSPSMAEIPGLHPVYPTDSHIPHSEMLEIGWNSFANTIYRYRTGQLSTNTDPFLKALHSSNELPTQSFDILSSRLSSKLGIFHQMVLGCSVSRSKSTGVSNTEGLPDLISHSHEIRICAEVKNKITTCKGADLDKVYNCLRKTCKEHSQHEGWLIAVNGTTERQEWKNPPKGCRKATSSTGRIVIVNGEYAYRTLLNIDIEYIKNTLPLIIDDIGRILTRKGFPQIDYTH